MNTSHPSQRSIQSLYTSPSLHIAIQAPELVHNHPIHIVITNYLCILDDNLHVPPTPVVGETALGHLKHNRLGSKEPVWLMQTRDRSCCSDGRSPVLFQKRPRNGEAYKNCLYQERSIVNLLRGSGLCQEQPGELYGGSKPGQVFTMERGEKKAPLCNTR